MLKKFNKSIKLEQRLIRDKILKKIVENMIEALNEGVVDSFIVSMGNVIFRMNGSKEPYSFDDKVDIKSKAFKRVKCLFEEWLHDYYLAANGFWIKKLNGEIVIVYSWTTKERTVFSKFDMDIFVQNV